MIFLFIITILLSIIIDWKIVSFYLIIYFINCRKPKIFCSEKWYLKNNKIYQVYYPFIFYHWTLQTLMTNYRRKKNWDYGIIMNTTDGDIFRVDVMEPDGVVKGNILVIHGFSGSSDSSYVLNIGEHLKKRNFRIWGYNYRGAKTEMLTKNFVHIGFIEDIELTVNYIKRDHKEPIILIGYSMGGILNTKYFYEKAQYDDSIKLGISVSMPLDLNKISKLMLKPIYLYTVNRSLLYAAISFFKKHKIISNTPQFHSFMDLYEYLLTNIDGYENLHDFYHENSPINLIPKIKKNL